MTVTSSVPNSSSMSWKEFAEMALHEPSKGYVFRGVSNCNWQARSSIERACADPSSASLMENAALGYFIERVRQLLPRTPDDDDVLAWLALMQHYGAPTRLLDFTASPFVAAYFAYRDPPPNSDPKPDRAIYVVNVGLTASTYGLPNSAYRDYVGTLRHVTVDKGNETLTFPADREHVEASMRKSLLSTFRSFIRGDIDIPFVLPIFEPDPRMIAQQGCFVVNRFSSDSTPMLDRLVADPKFGVRKIILKWEHRHEALVSLARMNITAATLFPGIDGMGRSVHEFLSAGSVGGVSQWLSYR